MVQMYALVYLIDFVAASDFIHRECCLTFLTLTTLVSKLLYCLAVMLEWARIVHSIMRVISEDV